VKDHLIPALLRAYFKAADSKQNRLFYSVQQAKWIAFAKIKCQKLARKALHLSYKQWLLQKAMGCL
jgi:hypothetical protein